MRRRWVLLALVGATGCPDAAAPPSIEETGETVAESREAGFEPPPPVPIERARDDDPLPDEDEIPDFLRAAVPAARDLPSDGPAAERPSWDAQPDAFDDPESSWAYVRVSAGETPTDLDDPDPDPVELPEEAAGARPDLDAYEVDPPTTEEKDATKADPCQAIRDTIARYEESMSRIQEQRQSYGWVGDPEDHAALQLLAGLRRCAEHPEDPDCAQPSMQARSVSASEIGRHPNELLADGKEPDEIVHDPFLLERQRELRRCEASHR